MLGYIWYMIRVLLRISIVPIIGLIYGLSAASRKQVLVRRTLKQKKFEGELSQSVAKMINSDLVTDKQINVQIVVTTLISLVCAVLQYKTIKTFGDPLQSNSLLTKFVSMAGALFVCYVCERKGRGFVIPVVTGSIASGKSTACEYLRLAEFSTLDIDDTYHELIKNGETLFDTIVERYGDSVLSKDKTTGIMEIDRLKLGEKARGDPKGFEKLNEVTHPVILQTMALKVWGATNYIYGAGVNLILDMPLLFETVVGCYIFCPIITITADENARYKRFANRTKEQASAQRVPKGRTMQINEAECRNQFNQFNKKQTPQKEKMEKSDIVVENDGTSMKFQETLKGLTNLIKEVC